MRHTSVATNDGYFGRFTSQIAVIGEEGQQKLRNTRVHIAGLGGLGNLLALFLSTTGVGYISANDPQRLEMENLGRFVCGEEADIGRGKAIAAARFLHRNRHSVFEPVVAPNESPLVNPSYEQADWIFSCANTVQGRVAAARRAIEFRKPIIDLGVADGRKSLSGSVRYWLPECADWSACPVCYLSPHLKTLRNEGLVLTVLAATSSLAAHVMLSLVTGLDAESTRSRNCVMVELGRIQVDGLAVCKRKLCPTCAKVTGPAETQPQGQLSR